MPERDRARSCAQQWKRATELKMITGIKLRDFNITSKEVLPGGYIIPADFLLEGHAHYDTC
jgi:hypothetical protein